MLYELRIYPDYMGFKKPESVMTFNDRRVAGEAAFDAAKGFRDSGREEFHIELDRDGRLELSISHGRALPPLSRFDHTQRRAGTDMAPLVEDEPERDSSAAAAASG